KAGLSQDERSTQCGGGEERSTFDAPNEVPCPQVSCRGREERPMLDSRFRLPSTVLEHLLRSSERSPKAGNGVPRYRSPNPSVWIPGAIHTRSFAYICTF